MVQRVSTVAFEGIEARAVDVQVQVAPGSARLCHRRPARQGGVRGPRAGPLGADRLRAGAPRTPNHRQSGARRSAQGRQPLRSADRARPDGGDRRHSAGCAFRLHRARRTRPRWIDRAGGGRIAGGDRRQFARRRPDLPRSLRGGSGLGEPGYPDRCRQFADPDRQPFQGHAGAVAATAEGARGRGQLCSICATSRARKAPSARSRLPRPAGIIC